MKFGAQLYTLRDELKKKEDVRKIFEFLRDQKCEIVELACLPEISPKELGELSRETGVEICSTHTDFEKIVKNVDRTADEHLEHGTKIIGIGGIPDSYRKDCLDGAKRFIEEFNKMAAAVEDRGIKFTYHNHAFEFEMTGNSCIEDILLLNASENVGFCLDVYWAKVGGVDVGNYINRIGTKLYSMHLKDYKRKLRFWYTTCPPGDGILDIPAFVRQAENFGTQYGLIEVDNGGKYSPRACIERGMKFLTENCK